MKYYAQLAASIGLLWVRKPLLVDPLRSGGQLARGQTPRSGPLNVTTIARLSVHKGLHHLLEAIVQVRKQYPETVFKVYGDGVLRQDLLEYSQRLGLDGEEIFVGSFAGREQLSEIMASTDIFVMSSISEGQPMVIVEAMAYGCPIVSTHVGGIPEMIKDRVNGLLCRPADPDALAENICHLIEDPGLRQSLGRQARQSYLQGGFPAEGDCPVVYESVYENPEWRNTANKRRPTWMVNCPVRNSCYEVGLPPQTKDPLFILFFLCLCAGGQILKSG